MKRIIAVLAALAAFPIAMPTAAQGDSGDTNGRFAVGGHASTLGLGVNMGYDFHDRGTARVVYNRYGLDLDRTVSGNDYDGEFTLESYGVLLDWFPRTGRNFHVTGGLLLNNTSAGAATEAEDVAVGDRSYSGAMTLTVDYSADAAPYLGVGWRGGKDRSKRLSFFADVGVLIQSRPGISASGTLSGTGLGICSIVVSQGGEADISGPQCNVFVPGAEPPELTEPADDALQDLEAEHRSLRADADNFGLWPVVLLGVAYSF